MSAPADIFGADGKPRVLSGQCATCIGRPGNPMDLKPGRLRRMLQDAVSGGNQGIVCHETLSYSSHPDFGAALCRWFYDTYGHLNGFIRIMDRCGGFTEAEPPQEAEDEEAAG